MRYWLGLGFMAAALWLLREGLAHRGRIVAARQESRPDGALDAPESPLTAFGEIVRPLIYAALGYLAIKTSFAYAMLDAGRYLSLFDLGGFLFLLASYGVWLSLKTRYRALVAAAAPAKAGRRQEPDDTMREAA